MLELLMISKCVFIISLISTFITLICTIYNIYNRKIIKENININSKIRIFFPVNIKYTSLNINGINYYINGSFKLNRKWFKFKINWLNDISNGGFNIDKFDSIRLTIN